MIRGHPGVDSGFIRGVVFTHVATGLVGGSTDPDRGVDSGYQRRGEGGLGHHHIEVASDRK